MALQTDINYMGFDLKDVYLKADFHQVRKFQEPRQAFIAILGDDGLPVLDEVGNETKQSVVEYFKAYRVNYSLQIFPSKEVSERFREQPLGNLSQSYITYDSTETDYSAMWKHAQSIYGGIDC